MSVLTTPLPKPATTALAAAGLVGGYAVARGTGIRPLGGVALAAAGAVCANSWIRTSGPARGGALLAIYLGAFGASHPLAKKIGAWPSVGAVAAGAAAAAQLISKG